MIPAWQLARKLVIGWSRMEWENKRKQDENMIRRTNIRMTVGELHHVEIYQSRFTSRIELFCRSEIKPIWAACELKLHLQWKKWQQLNQRNFVATCHMCWHRFAMSPMDLDSQARCSNHRILTGMKFLGMNEAIRGWKLKRPFYVSIGSSPWCSRQRAAWQVHLYSSLHPGDCDYQ